MREPERSTCAIVGIGASAGGLDALRRLLGALPADPPFAIVVIQHLDPSTRSQLAEIVDRCCELEVVRAKSGDEPARGTVYVVPEAREARLEAGRLRLRQRSKTCRAPIDSFFTSLAEHNDANGCGVVLSGNGSDGTLGLREIQGAGGITFAQEPSTAEFPSMPSTAIDSGVCDFVGSPEEIARDVMAHVAHAPLGSQKRSARSSKAEAQREANALGKILGLVRLESGIDFSGYKSTTVTRRVSRRAMLKDAETLHAYLALIEDDPAEIEALAGDLLINVTAFFRDPEVYETLGTRVFPEILKSKSDADTLRIWVVGCSTGEEVYSVLITALEALETSATKPKITVFGTDASESAIRKARAGVYPSSACASVSAERLSKYFVRTEAGLEIDRALRDMCVFARQDITKDTPFSRQDLVSLRNVLIYMDQPLQRQVLTVAHFALVPDGLLLLGTSETTDNAMPLFKPFDKRAHVYRRQGVPSRLPVAIANAAQASIDALSLSAPALPSDGMVFDAQAAANDMALLMYAPPRVAIDANGHVLHFFGDTAPFLKHAVGRATLDVAEMAHPGIALELKDAIEAARATDGRATRDVNFTSDGHRRHVSIEVMPLPSPPGQTQLMVAFREFSAADMAPASPITDDDLARLYEAREQRVRGELGAMRGRLRAVAEEREHVNQSLRSANEEIRSSNEELQSINEELETAKEELQSANEELITVNDELRQSNRDLSVVNDDLTNFASSIDLPVLMLDRSLRVRRFTPQASRVIRIEDSDVGRLLGHLRLLVDVTDLPGLAASVLESETPRQLETKDEDGCWYHMSLRPYRSAGGAVDGVVVAFADVDELKRGAELLERRARLGEALAAIDADLASTMEFDEIMRRALDAGVEALGADAGIIEERERDSWVIRYQHGFTGAEVGRHLSEEDAPNATEAARLGAPVMIADLPADKESHGGFLKAHGLKSVLAVPLVVPGSTIGCLLFYHRTAPRGFTPDEVDFGRGLGTSVSLALENSRLMRAEHEAMKRAETLNAINEIMRTALTPDELLARLVGEASEVAGAEMSLVIEVREDGFVITHVRGLREDLVGVLHSAEHFPAFALAAQGRSPVLIDDTWTDPRTNKDFVVPNGLRAFELLPLTVGGAVVAVLALAFGEPREFDASEEAFADRVCTAMSIALGNARLFESEVSAREAARRELVRTALLLKVAGVLAGPEDLATRLATLATIVSSGLVHDRVVVDLWDERPKVLSVVAVYGGPPPPKPCATWDEMSPAGQEAVSECRTVTVDYSAAPDSIRERSAKAGFKYALLVPMVVGGRAVGLIVADQPQEVLEFGNREIALLESIATQAAVAVENDRLFAAEVAAQERASRELETTTALLEAASSVARWTDLTDVVSGLAETLLRSTRHTRVIVSVWDEANRELVVAGSRGERALDVGGRWPIDEVSVAARSAVLERRTEVWDLDAISGSQRGIALDDLAMDFALYVPLVQRDAVVGLLIVDNPGERREFSEREIELIEGIAAHAAVAMENARLFEAEQVELARTTILREVAAAAASTIDVRELSERALAACRERLGVKAGTVYVFDRPSGALAATALFGFPKLLLRQLGRMELDEARAGARSYMLNEVVTHDSPGLPSRIHEREEAAKATEDRWVSMPIRVRGEAVGSLGLIFQGRRSFNADEIALYQALADQLGVGLDKARLFEAEVTAGSSARALADISALVTSSTDAPAALRAALARGADAIGAIGAILASREEGGWRTTQVHGMSVDEIGDYHSDEDSPARRRVFETREPYLVADVLADADADPGLGDSIGYRSYAAYPLVYRDEVIGALSFFFAEPRSELTAAETDFATRLVYIIAAAKQNARSLALEQNARRRVEALQRVAEFSACSLDLVEIVDKAAAFFSETLGVDVITFWRLDHERRALFPVTGVGFPLEFFDGFSGGVGIDQPFEIARAVVDSKAVVRSAGDIGLVPEPVRASYAKFGVPLGALLVVPVRSGSRALGAMTLAWQEPREISEDDVAFFSSAADQIAVGAENAILFDAVRESARLDEALNAIDVNIHSTLDFEEIMRRSLGDGVTALGCDAGTIEVREADGWSIRFQQGFRADSEGRTLSDAEAPIATRAMRLRRPLAVADVVDDDVANVGFVAENNLRSVLAAPLIVRNEVTGCLLFYQRERTRMFDEPEIDFAVKLAASVSLATERAELFASEQRAFARTTLLKEIATIGAGTLDSRDLAERVLGAMRRLLGAKSGNLFVLDKDAGVLHSLASFGVPKKALKAFETVRLDSDTTTARVALKGQIETHAQPDTVDTSARVAKLTGKPGVGWVALPVGARGVVIGTLGLSFDDDRPFDADELALFGSLADQVGIALERAMFFSDLQSSREQVTNVLQSISDGFYALDREWRFTYANAEAGRMMGIPHASIVGRTMGEMLGDAAFEFQKQAFAPAMFEGTVVEFERFFPQTGIWADVRVFPSVEGVAVYGRDITERKVAEQALRETRERAEMMASLLDESSQPFAVGNMDGSMGLVNSAFERLTGYTAEELRSVSWATKLTPPEYADMEAEMLGRLLSSGEPVRYEKAYIRKDGAAVPVELLVHLFRGEGGEPRHYYAFVTDLSERKQLERLDAAFNEIRTAIGGTLDFSAIVREALSAGAKALDADSGAVFNRARSGWCITDSVGLPQAMSEGVFTDAETLVGPLVAAEGQAIMINAPAADSRLDASLVRRYRIKSLLAAPLGIKGADLGVMVFYHRKKAATFTEAQHGFAIRLARVVALAIQNSMLYERERTIADTLQEALLMPPERIAGIDTSYIYRPASATANVGGDFYDVFSIAEDKCVIVVGDVSGKGLVAARLTSLIHDGIRAYTLETSEPSEILTRLNRLVCHLSPPEQFATLFFGVLNTQSGLMRYCTAGHPSPAVLDANGATYLFGTHSPVLGAFAHAPFHCFDTVLAPGNRLLLFTDGVTEARNGTEFLGDEGLLKMLAKMVRTPTQRLPQRLLDRVLHYADGHLRDDTVILCVERTAARKRP